MDNYIIDEKKYENISDLINNGGTIEIGYQRYIKRVAFAYDEGGTIWEGKKKYKSIKEILEDAGDIFKCCV
ncbi:MAG: hypothetical protein GY804_06520 [Alphaproteobacteria bacterium]|nr:hypothetical protein [Alphaproteobacteria bacterium]